MQGTDELQKLTAAAIDDLRSVGGTGFEFLHVNMYSMLKNTAMATQTLFAKQHVRVLAQQCIVFCNDWRCMSWHEAVTRWQCRDMHMHADQGTGALHATDTWLPAPTCRLHVMTLTNPRREA